MISRILKIYSLFLSQNIKKEMIYRANFITLLLIDFVGIGVPVIFFSILFKENATLVGWSFEGILILIGCVGILREMAYLTFRAGFQNLSGEIKLGLFDLILIKPFPPQLLLIFQKLSLTESVGEGVLGLLLIIYSLIHLGIPIDFFKILVFIFFILVAFLLYYSISLLVNALAFWVVRVEGLNMLVWTFMEMARYPRDILHGIGKIIFTFIIPVSLVATVPSSVLAGLLNPELAGLLMVITIFFFSLANFIWKKGIKRYESASS